MRDRFVLIAVSDVGPGQDVLLKRPGSRRLTAGNVNAAAGERREAREFTSTGRVFGPRRGIALGQPSAHLMASKYIWAMSRLSQVAASCPNEE